MDPVAELRDAANLAFDGERFEDAIALLGQLEAIDPDPDHAKKIAQAYHRLGDAKRELDALNRAARGYADRNEILKAAVTSKLILAIDPDHEETRRRIPELMAKRDAELKLPPRSLPPPPPSPEGAARIRAAVHDFYFRDVLPQPPMVNAVPIEATGLRRLKLRDEVPEDFELIVEDPIDAPLSPATLGIDTAGNIVRPSMSIPPSPATDVLKSTLFAGLSPSTFTVLMEQARLLELKDGEELFHQGEIGDALYVVVSGTVGVIDEGPPRRGVTKLGERSIFGEIAVLTDQPRTATVVALGSVQVIAIDRAVVGTLAAHDPRFVDALLRFLRDRLVDRLLATNPLFTSLSERDRKALKPRFQLFEVDEGATLIEQGKLGQGLLILLAGHAEAVRDEGDSERVLGSLVPGDVAGEISLITEQPSIARVRATSRCLVISLPAQVFYTIVRARPDAMSFIQRLIDKRLAQSRAIVSGDAPHAEGHVLKTP